MTDRRTFLEQAATICGTFAMDEAVCPTRALKFYGKPMTIDDFVLERQKRANARMEVRCLVVPGLTEDQHGAPIKAWLNL